MSCLGKGFESVTKKIEISQRLKNFGYFWVFILSQTANSKIGKQRKVQKTLFQWQINDWNAVFMGQN